MAKITSMKLSHIYPELEEKLDFIISVLNKEEENFNKTLSFGTQVLSELIRNRGILINQEINISNDVKEVSKEIIGKLGDGGKKKLLSGTEAFILYDTYGFPIEITSEICEEFGLGIDIKSFNEIMDKQKDRSKKSINKDNNEKIYSSLKVLPTNFLGYETLNSKAKVLAIIKNNKIQKKVKTGDSFEIIRDRSPFYAEMGGQLGDTGICFSETGEFEVLDTKNPFGGIFVHESKMKSGEISEGSEISMKVEKERREKIKRNHTATHLLHAALREIIGSHVRQSGSLVHPDYLRFDFTNLEALDDHFVKKIEDKVNEYIRNKAVI